MPESDKFSKNGNEISFVTIGDSSTSEGVFWETINAAAVMKVPLLIAVWDDGYGISVPVEMQTVKGSISKALAGFELDKKETEYVYSKQKDGITPGFVPLLKKQLNGSELNIYRQCCMSKNSPSHKATAQVVPTKGISPKTDLNGKRIRLYRKNEGMDIAE